MWGAMGSNISHVFLTLPGRRPRISSSIGIVTNGGAAPKHGPRRSAYMPSWLVPLASNSGNESDPEPKNVRIMLAPIVGRGTTQHIAAFHKN